MIALDETAMKACKQNNETVVLDNKDVPEIGGNEDLYKAMLGAQQKSGAADEGTYFTWEGNGMEMVLINLLQEYEAFVNPQKEDKKGGQRPALLDPLTVKMGCSFKAHKKAQNIAQLLYVRQLGNAIE